MDLLHGIEPQTLRKDTKMAEKKSKLILMMVALCLATIAAMGDMVIIPVADFLYTNYDMSAASYILTAPALICAVVSAFAGKIIEKMGARKFLIIGFGIYTLSAVLTAFSQNEIVLLVCRTLQGIGMGALGVCAVVIISEHFIDEKKRSSMIGIYNGMMALVGAALGMLSGIVAAAGWTTVFWIYLVTIPIFILLILFIPKDTAEAAEDTDVQAAPKSKMPWGIVIRVAASFFVYNLIYCVVYYQIAVICVDKGVVDTAFIGLLSSLATIGSFVACSTFGLYFPKTKRFTITIAYALMAVFFIVLYLATEPAPIAIASTLLGACYGLGLSYFLTYATMVVPPEHIPMSTAVVTFAMGISSFLASYVPHWIMAAMGTESITATIPPMVIVLGIGCVLTIFFGLKERHYFDSMSAPAETKAEA